MLRSWKYPLKSVAQSVKLVNGHDSVGLPLRGIDMNSPNNPAVAVQRAEKLRRTFTKNVETCQDYETFVDDYEDLVKLCYLQISALLPDHG